MEEKIIEAKFKKNRLFHTVYIGSIGLIVLVFLGTLIVYLTGEGNYGVAGMRPYTEMYDSYFDYIVKNLWFVALFIIGVLGILVSRFFIWFLNLFSLTVTTRRVTGKCRFGKTVDLPLTQISAVSLGVFDRISIATSSGSIHFLGIENRSEVYEALSEIIGNVQMKGNDAQSRNPASIDNADELKKYKDLLDSGVITQEEFDAKKKQILGL